MAYAKMQDFLTFRPKIGTLILGWVLVPLISLGALSVVSLMNASKEAQQVRQVQTGFSDTAQNVAEISNQLGSGLLHTYQVMTDLRETRQNNVAAGRFDPKAETDLRSALRNGVQKYLRDTTRFTSLTQAIGHDDPTLKASVDGISRYALQADRLVSLYIVSNSRTLRFLQAGEDGNIIAAQSNYKFEEQFLLNSIENNLSLAAELFNESSSSVLQFQAQQQENALLQADLRMERLQSQTVSVTAAGVLAVAILAFLGVKKTIISPIRKIPEMITEVGNDDQDSNSNISLLGKRRNEIGDIVRAVEEFGQSLNQKKVLEQEAVRRRFEEQMGVVEVLGQGLMALSSGDLSTRIPSEMPADYEALRGHFNGAVQDLMTSLSGILDASETIQTEVTQIVSTSEGLSVRNQTQAHSLEEISLSVSALTKATASLSVSANDILENAKTMRTNAGQSLKFVEDNAVTMGDIHSSSEEIAKITDLISDIAFQTNILALNASVEAARAGSGGLGFAVVANEVRALASRAAEAAESISNLIGQSSKKIQKGHELAGLMNEDLKEMGTMIEAVYSNISEIAISVTEQSTGTDEIRKALEELDTSAQSSAAISEELTANTQVLRGQCGRLNSEINKFSLDNIESSEDFPNRIVAA